jgi:hypothetical protein
MSTTTAAPIKLDSTEVEGTIAVLGSVLERLEAASVPEEGALVGAEVPA